MSQNEIERIKTDLEVMKKAAGIKRTYTRKEVCISVIMGVIGLLLAGLDVFVLKAINKFLSLFIIFAVMFLMVVASNVGKQEDTSHHRQPKSYQWVIFVTGFLFMMGYIFWENRFNLPRDLYLGIMFMFWGAVTAIESYWRTRQPYDAILLAPMIISGALVPLYPSHILTVFGLPIAIGALTYAGVIAYVIRRQRVNNDAD